MTEVSEPSFLIGSRSSDHLTIRVLRRSHPRADDYWDGNWLTAEVEVRAGGFRGSFEASLRTNEFAGLREGLARLHHDLVGDAAFNSMEDWVVISVTGDGRGHFQAECEVMDEAGIGNRLTFALGFDQTEIPAILGGIDRILEHYPVVGA